MESSIGGGSTPAQYYQRPPQTTGTQGQPQVPGQVLTQHPDASGKVSGHADAALREIQRDLISQSDAGKQSQDKLGGKIGSPSNPKLASANPNSLMASEADIRDFQQALGSSASENSDEITSSLPMDVQKALYSGSGQSNEELGGLAGQVAMTSGIGALASLGLQSVPQAPPVNYSNMVASSGFPPAGPILSSDTPEVQNAKLVSNGLQTTANATRILNAQIQAQPGTSSDAQSITAFLKAIGDAITKLQKFLDQIEQSDSKANKMGQAFDAGSDSAKLAEDKQAKAKSSSGGGGGIFSFLDSIPIIGPMLAGKGIGSLGGIGSMLTGVLNMNIPIVSDILKAIASMTKGIPIVGDICQMIADHPMLLILAIAAAVVVAFLAIGTGGWGIGLALAAGAAVFVGGALICGAKIPILSDLFSPGNNSGQGGSSDSSSGGGISDILGSITGIFGGGGGSSSSSGSGGGGGGFLGDLLNPNSPLPIVGGLLSGITGMIDKIPIVGSLFQMIGGDNQKGLLLAAIAFVAVSVVACMFLGPYGLLVGAAAALVVMLAMQVVSGHADSIPIVGSLLDSMGISGMINGIVGDVDGSGGGGGGKSTSASSSGSSAEKGTAQVVANTYGTTAEKLAKNEGSTDDNAALIGQIQQLLAMLIQIKNGGKGAMGTAKGQAEDMAKIAKALSEAGIGGIDMQEASTDAQQGKYIAMVEALTRAFQKAGTDPTQMGAVGFACVDTQAVSSSQPSSSAGGTLLNFQSA